MSPTFPTPSLRARAATAVIVALAAACDRGDAARETVAPTPESERPSSAAASGAAEAPVEPPTGAAPTAPSVAPAVAPATGPAALGEPAPAFTLTDQAGEAHALADHRGKIVVLEWTNPQCPFVQRHAEAATMKSLVDRFPGDRVVWLAIDSSHFVEPEDSSAWREAHGLSYPILQDPDGAVGRAYGARTTPHMFIVDAEGVLRYSGAIDDDAHGRTDEPTNHVERAVEALLAGDAPPVAQTEPYGCSVKYRS